MDTRDILKATESTKRLVQDDEYYRFIFKKTEKIVSVVFFVSNNIETSDKNRNVISDILDTARGVHNAILHTLETRAHLAEDAIRATAHSLISLDSKLRIASTIGIISSEVLHVLVEEIDGVLRGLNKYLVRTTAFDDLNYRVATSKEETRAPKTSERIVERRANSGEMSGKEASTDNNDRRERIKVVLGAKGEATIKDITDIITDVSSKTIQRELNAMIEDSIIKREGERRWSKYSLM